MSTRGAIGFKIDGEYKVTYNHSDSYPEYLGDRVVEFMKKVVKEKKLDILRENVRNVKMRLESTPPTAMEQERFQKFADTGVSSGNLDEWYVLLRNAQGIEGIEAIYKGKLDVMINSFRFLADSLFCEYAYIINLDNDTIEFYKGFNKQAQKTNPLPIDQKKDDSGYYPVRFKGSCPFTEIPEDWQRKFYPQER